MISRRGKIYQVETASELSVASKYLKSQTNSRNHQSISRLHCDSEAFIKSETENLAPGQVQPRPRPTRLPKMGVMSVTRTSTPKSETSSPKSSKMFQSSSLNSPQSPKIQYNFDYSSPKTSKFLKSPRYKSPADEPIYCEIVTPVKSPNKSEGGRTPNLIRNYSRQSSNPSDTLTKSPAPSRSSYRRKQMSESRHDVIRSQAVPICSVSNPNSNFSTSNSLQNEYNLGRRMHSRIPDPKTLRACPITETSPVSLNFARNSNKPEVPSKIPVLTSSPNRIEFSWKNQVVESPVRSRYIVTEQDTNPLFRSPIAPKMSQSVYGLGRRAHTQVEIPISRWRRDTEESVDVDSSSQPFQRHRWERHSVNSEATSLASYGTHGDDGVVVEPRATLLKGVMWLQREKVFSRWKERFFVLTKDYLQCFKKSTSLITEMGGFVFRVRLCEVDELELIIRRGYLTICLGTPKTGKLLLRKPDGIRKWYQILQECVTACKERQESEREKNRFLMRKQLTDSSSMEAWIQSRKLSSEQNWIETGSCISAEAANTLSRQNPMNGSRKSLETTDYGFIDGPQRRMLLLQRELKSIDERLPSSPCPSSVLLSRKSTSNKIETSSTFSRDSGIDSMNAANSPGSILSNRSSNVTGGALSRTQTESPTPDVTSTSFNFCDQFNRKITLV